MASIAGKVAPRFMGEYNASTTYQFYDAVTRNNKLYFCKKSGTVGKAPGNATDDNWFLSLDGTFTDAAELGGETATQWQTKIDNIQTTSKGTLSQAGWYRVAHYKGSTNGYARGNNANGCELVVKSVYGNVNHEMHILLLSSVYDKQTISSILDATKNTGSRAFTKCRYVYEGTNAYLEVYYGLSQSNFCSFEVNHQKDYYNTWKAITPTLTSETVDGVTVTTTYDIPANASPVTDLDLAQFNSVTINTSILEHALTLPTGTYQFYLGAGNYTGEDLPNKSYRYGRATVLRTSSRATVILYGIRGVEGAKRLAINHYDTEWSGWETYATTADLANYLPKTGGELSGSLTLKSSDTTQKSFEMQNSARRIVARIQTNGNFYLNDATNSKNIFESSPSGVNSFIGTATGNLPLESSVTTTVSRGNSTVLNFKSSNHNDRAWVQFSGSSETLGYLGFLGKDNPVFSKSTVGNYTLHHDGNSAKVAIQESAPTDTSALWVDSTNKKTKAYIDGAWTALA